MRNARIALLSGLLACSLLPAAAGAQSRIVGGSPASGGEYPAQTYLRIDLGAVSLQCGGTLISKTKVATAAHCMDVANYALPVVPVPVTIAPGSVTAFLGSNRAGMGTEHAVSAVEIHPDYDPSTSANDIAVLTLEAAATQEPLPIITPATDAADYAVGKLATVIGWGTTMSGGDASEDLLEVEVPIVSDADCDDGNSYDGSLVTDVMLCAGLAAGGKDSCQGDSGGPLMVRSAGVFKLTGIVSFGDGCAAPDKYGVYTEVPAPAIRDFLVTEAGAPPTVGIDPVTGAKAGTASALHATAADATTGGSITSILWDLDADGAFDDAAGADVSFIPASAGDHVVRVKATDTDGMTAATERTVTATAASTAPPAPTPTPTPAPAAPQASAPSMTPAPATRPSGGGASSDPAATSSAGKVRAKLTKVFAKGRKGTLRVRGTVAGNPCTAGKVRVTVTRGGKRVGRKVLKVSTTCAFATSFKTRGRVRIAIAFLADDGTVTALGTRTRRTT